MGFKSVSLHAKSIPVLFIYSELACQASLRGQVYIKPTRKQSAEKKTNAIFVPRRILLFRL